MSRYSRILFDVTSLTSVNWNTGIQRTARGLTLAGFKLKKKNAVSARSIYFNSKNDCYKFMPLYLEWLKLPPNCRNWLFVNGYLKRFSRKVNLGAGDLVMLVDVCWPYPVGDVLSDARAQGAKVLWLLYDLIPLRFSGTTEPNNERMLGIWVSESLKFLDYVCGISEFVAKDYSNYLGELGYINSQPKVIYSRLSPSIKRRRTGGGGGSFAPPVRNTSFASAPSSHVKITSRYSILLMLYGRMRIFLGNSRS